MIRANVSAAFQSRNKQEQEGKKERRRKEEVKEGGRKICDVGKGRRKGGSREGEKEITGSKKTK